MKYTSSDRIIKLVGALALSTLVACGGGGGGSNPEPNVPIVITQNVAPSSDAGVDQSVNEGSDVQLNGSGSDSDGSIASYAWIQTSGGNVELNNNGTANATFAAPQVDIEQALTFQLTVTDNDNASSTDEVTIIVINLNQSPSSDAGVDQSVNEGTEVQLTGSGADSDGTIISYAWIQTSGVNIALNNNDTSNASFTAPQVDTEQALTFQLTVMDNDNTSSTDEVTIVVGNVNQSLSGSWSDPQTWGGSIPIADEVVVIAQGNQVILDVNPPNLGGIIIEQGATLEFARADISLTTKYIVVDGVFQIGTEEEPFTQKAIITLTDTNPEVQIMGMGTRGLMVNGTLELHGATPDILWTKLNQSANAGSTELTLKDTVSWQVGDDIIITPTDYYEAANGNSVTQKVTLTEVAETQLSINEGLNAQRWGRLQYVTDNAVGLSLNPADILVDASITSSLILDERAEVANLTRNIVIQAPDDEVWQNDGFGAITMIMPNGTGHVEGVEFVRGGQRGKMGRYPFHWHMLSYANNQLLSDATGQYFKNNSIAHSTNRGIVIHGTNGVLVQNNIIFDIKGHGIFLEDAVERRNTIDGNLIFKIRSQEDDGVLLQHETGQLGASAIWLSNPDNTVTNNVVGDSQTFGYWLSFSRQTWGLNKGVKFEDGAPLRPANLQFGVFKDNATHSNRRQGFMLDLAQSDDAGNTNLPGEYHYTIDNKPSNAVTSTTLRRYTLEGTIAWKNSNNGIWDRSDFVDNIKSISADNAGRFFAGSGRDGVIKDALAVGTSLNHMANNTDRPPSNSFFSTVPTAFASYHSAFSIHDNVVVNFPAVEGRRSGVFATDDLYFRAVERGMARNTNNYLINSDPGVKIRHDSPDQNLTFSSALWDPQGLWGPANNYLVYDVPFLTEGKVVTVNPLGTDVVGGVSVPGPFYGFRGFVPYGVGTTIRNGTNLPHEDYMAIKVDRVDSDMNLIDTWIVEEALRYNQVIQHMRDFATTPDGLYILSFPSNPTLPNDFQMFFDAMYEESDQQVMGISFDGTLTNLEVFSRPQGRGTRTDYVAVNSLQEVIDSNGETWWQDSAENIVWVKIKGGRWEIDPIFTADIFNIEQEEKMELHISPL